MFAYLAIGAAALLGWALYGSQSKPSSSTPLQNSLSGSPYQPGQTVRVPFNQLPPNTVPPAMLTTFQQVQADGIKVKVTSVQPGMVNGNLISTYGPGGDIMMPTPLPVTIPTGIIAGLA